MLKKITYTVAAITIASGLCSCHSSKRSGDEAAINVDVSFPEVDSLVLHKSYPAYLAAIRYVDIVARVSGILTAQFFDDGAFVKKGQPLFTIESTAYREKVNEAEAQLQTALATHEYNTKQYEAMKKALESDAVSKMDVVQAESAVKESEASIKSSRAALENARLMLGYCTIYAPFDGHVAAPPFIVGDYIGGEESPVTLTTIYDDSSVSAHFSVEGADYLALRNTPDGRAVDYNHIPVEFGDTISHKYTGKLEYEAPAVDRQTGTMALRLTVDNPAGELRSGMYATVLLPYAVDPKAIVIKDASIGTDQLGKYVYLVNDSDKVVYTPITVGELYRDTLRIVTAGLKPTDRYVTKALMKVRDGMTVKPIDH